jgi:succinate dehydrogenase / fumarate reductase cytochrome b subunit
MSAATTAINVNTPGGFVRRALKSSLGAKLVMAITGLLMVVWLVLHLAGNLAIYAGAGPMNEYAHFLKSKPELLWPMRVGLLVIVTLHIVSGLRLAMLNRAARPEGYRSPRRWRQATVASRTMLVSGLFVLAFIVFHLLHFTGGLILSRYYAAAEPTDPVKVADVYSMVVQSFRQTWVVIVYAVGMFLVGLHLSHGVWSGVQSLGLNGRRWTPLAQRLGFWFGVVLALGFASIPLTIGAHLAGR